MSDPVLMSVDGGVATLTLNRPEAMNAWNPAMAAGLDSALRACDANDDVRAVVLTGAGRAFCAGADLGGGGETFKPREGGMVGRGAGEENPVYKIASGVFADQTTEIERMQHMLADKLFPVPATTNPR